MSGKTPVMPQSSHRWITCSMSKQPEMMPIYHEEESELQDESDVSVIFHHTVSFNLQNDDDDETEEVIADKGKQWQCSHSPADSVHNEPPPHLTTHLNSFPSSTGFSSEFLRSAGSPSEVLNLSELLTEMPILTGNSSQSITCTAGNLMDIMHDARDELREYQKEVKYALDTKLVMTFDGSNYEA
ncbi:hypothetical protein EMPG_12470 [Blastomyces silverae]|uniref:Uncharacterized protein n=1 Tax=Blastomyces silverae TaxID=2060906 RepID=A0A0H1BLV9_9EURO|nr:hypothetical protein EMPG_12470 [Blastomyces silverae]